jgi:SAM-dependent methyltransferase
MNLNVEIGGSFTRNGWINLENRIHNFNVITDNLPFENNSVDYFYMSHVIEHIPVICAYDVAKKLYEKLKPGGRLRIICPDLEVIIKAYINKDISIFNNEKYQLGTVPEKYRNLGIGGCLVSQIVTATNPDDDNDSYLFSKRKEGKLLSVFSHISGWDYEMIHNLLKTTGFSSVERSSIEAFDTHQKLGQLCVNSYK